MWYGGVKVPGLSMSAWERGRSLLGITQGDNAISYTYDADRIRVSKTVNGEITKEGMKQT